MNSYRNHIVDILEENICLSKADLYLKSGIDNKKEFIKEVQKLVSARRIRCEGDITGHAREVLSPKVLKLVEFENRCNAHTRSFIINYAPTDVLEKVLEYAKPGIDPFEDELDFHLEIMGYKLEEKYKAFFETENGFTLDFTKFHYNLWAEYLFPKYKDFEPKSIPNIIYVDSDVKLAGKLMKEVKEQYVPDSTWYHFLNYSDASFFFENTLQNRTYISFIVVRCNSTTHTIDFILKMHELLKVFYTVYSDFFRPIIILEESGCAIDFGEKQFNKEWTYLPYPANEDVYIIGNVMKSSCHNS